MSTKSKKWSLMLAAAVLAVWLGGCGNDGTNGQQGNGGPAEATPSPSAEAPTPTPSPEESPDPSQTDAASSDAERRTVTLYESDDQLMEMVTREVEVSFQSDDELIAATFAELQKEPDNGNISLMNKLEILSLKLDGDLLTIDLHIPQEGRFGTSGEMMLIAALMETSFQFSFINELDILVDGEATETLMGHIELEHPLTRE